MFCPKCGSHIPDDAAFCGNCGAKLRDRDASNKGDGSGAASAYNESSASGKKTSRIGNFGPLGGIIIAAVLVTVVLAIVFIASALGSHSGQTGESYEGYQQAQEEGLSADSGDDSVENGQTDEGDIQAESPQKSLKDYSWTELSNISAEIASATSEEEAVNIAKGYGLCTADGRLDGDQVKQLTLTDGLETSVQIAGFWHDEKPNGGKAGITFIFNDAIAEHGMNPTNTNSGGWEMCQMRKWLASDVMDMLPKELQLRIIEVEKLTNNVGVTDSVSSVTPTSDKLWLYSKKELLGDIKRFDTTGKECADEILNAEGEQYKLFRDNNLRYDQPKNFIDRDFKGELCCWWMRSPKSTFPQCFHDTIEGYSQAENNCGVVPGFCI